MTTIYCRCGKDYTDEDGKRDAYCRYCDRLLKWGSEKARVQPATPTVYRYQQRRATLLVCSQCGMEEPCVCERRRSLVPATRRDYHPQDGRGDQ